MFNRVQIACSGIESQLNLLLNQKLNIMKKIVFFFSVFLISFGLISQNLPFSDGFESGDFTTGGWTITGSAQISNQTPFQGVYCVKGLGTYSIEKNISSISDSIISVEYKMKASQTGSNCVMLAVKDTSENASAFMFFRHNGFIVAYDGPGYSQALNLMPYNSGTWYSIKIDLNMNAKTYDVYVDGQLEADNFNFYDSSFTSPYKFFWNSGETWGTGWIDDIIVSGDSTAINGCDDLYATNYNPNATINDNSCLYNFVCNQTVAASLDTIDQSQLNSLLLADSATYSQSGSYVYRFTANAGGGYASHTEFMFCLDGVTPLDGIVLGISDDNDVYRTEIGTDPYKVYSYAENNLYHFNNMGWVDASAYSDNDEIFMLFDSKWGSNNDSYITWWFSTNTPISNLGYVQLDSGTGNVGTIQIEGHYIETIVTGCDDSYATNYNPNVTVFDNSCLYNFTCNQTVAASLDTIDQAQLNNLLLADSATFAQTGTYVYRFTANAGGGYASNTEFMFCLDGVTPLDGIVLGTSDDNDNYRTQIGTDPYKVYSYTENNLYHFNNMGWVDASAYSGSDEVFMVFNSMWGSNNDSYITWWFSTNTPISNLGYVQLDSGTGNVGTIQIEGHYIETIVTGCDDSYATNYNPNVTVFDNSCLYNFTCNQTVAASLDTIDQAQLNNLLLADSATFAQTGTYVYRFTANAGGGYASNTEFMFCLDGVTPLDGIVLGTSDDNDNYRTQIGTDPYKVYSYTENNLYHFNNMGWVDASAYSGSDEVFMVFNSMWGSNNDSYITWWFSTNTPISNLGYVQLDSGTGNVGTIQIEGYYLDNPIYGCTDPAATNYNPLATIDDGSCIYVIPCPWNYTNTGANHTILIPNNITITIDGIQISPGDKLGVFFDSSNTLACGGFTSWNGNSSSVTAWGDDSQTPLKDGFSSNEVFTWKIWDSSTGIEYLGTASYNTIAFPNEGQYVTNGMSGLDSLEASTCDTQIISINQGWSIISTYIDPDYPLMDSLFSDILSNIIIVKDGAGGVFWPLYGVNGIGNHTVGEGYQIKVSVSCDLVVRCIAVVPENTPIQIPQGWSIIGYLRSDPANIAGMMSPIVSEIIIMKSGGGFVYWPQWGLNTIGNMNPGEGYQIDLTSAQTFTYPANGASTKSNIQNPKTEYFISPKNTGSNMTLGIPIPSWETSPNYGDEIGLFNQSGLLVGSGVFTGENIAITIWGDDEYSESIDGLLTNEEFTIKLWSNEIEQELVIESWIEGDGSYETNKIAVAEKINQSSIINNHSYRLNQNSPNPFTHQTEFSFYLPEKIKVDFYILNMLGEVVEILISEEMVAGKHGFKYQTQNLSAGSYYYRLKTAEYSETKKMVIIK